MIPSANPAGFRLCRFTNFFTCIPLARRARRRIDRRKKTGADISAGRDTLPDDALICLSRSPFVKKKYDRKKYELRLQIRGIDGAHGWNDASLRTAVHAQNVC